MLAIACNACVRGLGTTGLTLFFFLLTNLEIMKQLTQFFLVALLLLAAGLGAGDVMAQADASAKRYYASTSGKTTTMKSDCENPSDPCDIGDILKDVTGLVQGDQIAILVSAAGAVVEITDDVMLSDSLNFAFYTNDGVPTNNEAGTLKFKGNLTLSANGVITSTKLARVIASPLLKITARANQRWGRRTVYTSNIPGAVTISEGNRVLIQQVGYDDCIKFDDLTIGGRTQVEIYPCQSISHRESQLIIQNSLTVNGELKLGSNAVIDMSVENLTKTGLDKAFVEVNSARGISGFGGKLRLSITGGYPEPDFANVNSSAVYKGKDCFSVRGSGPIELDLAVGTAQYICVTVSKIGAGGTSTISAGTVSFGATELDGNLVNEGYARTQFVGALKLTGDLTVDGRYLSHTGWKNPLTQISDNGITTVADYNLYSASGGVGSTFLDPPIVAIDSVGWGKAARTNIAACYADRRPGVHLFSSSEIQGDVVLTNIGMQMTKIYQHASTDTDPDTPGNQGRVEAGHYAIPCQPGLFLQAGGTATTIAGTLRAQELNEQNDNPPTRADIVGDLGGNIYLGATATSQHNLVLHGDVDLSGSMTNVSMARPAGNTINGCTSGLPATGASGNKVIFAGTSYQSVTFSTDITTTGENPTTIDRTLMLDALTVDKSAGNVEFRGGSAGVEVKYLEPLNGMLYSGTALSGGSLLDGGTLLYTAGSGTVSNQGSGRTWRISPSHVVYAGGDHTIGSELGSAYIVTVLSSGTVSLTKKTRLYNLNLYGGTLATSDTLFVNGDLKVGNKGDLDLTGGPLHHHRNGALHYNGNMEREAGMAWMASDAMPAAATDKRVIRIKQDCGDTKKPGLVVNLNAGFTAVGGTLEVLRGTLDLNGNTLIVEDRVGGQYLFTGSLFRPEFQQLGEIVDSDGSGSIRLGRADKEAKTTLYIINKDQKFPAVHVVGGSVHIWGPNIIEGFDKAKLTLSSLNIAGGKWTNFFISGSLDHFEVSGDLTMAGGSFGLGSPVNVFNKYMQAGGFMYADGKRSLTVSDTFSVASGAVVALGDSTTLSLGGDVMVAGSVANPALLTVFTGTKTAKSVSYTPMSSSGKAQKLGDVTVNSGAGIMLANDLVQNATATLKLERGVVATGDYAWTVTNSGIEKDMINRTSVPMTSGNVATIYDGSRASFVAGTARRTIAHGTSGSMGSAKGGYLFPTGSMASDADRRARYRPLIIQFPADLSPVITADVGTYSGTVMWPSEGVDASGATLDTYASAMWMVNLSGIPAQDPNIRVMAEGLTGVNDARKLHVVQWDCDGTNARVTGQTSGSGLDDSLLDGNGRISNMFIVTSAGVALEECTILGIAAKHSENPIGDGPPAATPMANVQLIHNIVGATVDVYVDDVKLVDDFGFQQATSLSTAIAAGQHSVHVVPATAADNSNPIATIPVELAANGKYTVIANGDLTNFDFAMLSNTRSEAVTDDMVEFRVVHGAASLGEVDLRSLTETGRWANNLDFNEATGYRTAEATVHNVELLNGNTQVDVFEFDLGDYINQTLVLALSGSGTSSATGLTIIGVTTAGDIFTPQVVTSAQSEELPTEFALQGNYPNPFNPSTQIQFDLPSTADVTIQVIDLLGRMVLELPAQTMEAGANQTVELNGASMPSGTYFYRLIANMESGVEVKTGRMMLIK